MLVLANVAAPTPEQAERLGQLVREGMGLMIFTGAKLDVGPLQRPALPGRTTGSCRARSKALVDERHSGPVRRAGAALAAREAAGAEALGARARGGPPDHGGGRAGRAEDQVRVLARWNNPRRSPAVIERVVGDGPGPALDDHRRPRGQRLADRAELRAGRPRGRARDGAADLVGQHGHGRRADAAGRPLQPAGLQRPARLRPAAASRGRLRPCRSARTRSDRGPAVAIEVPDTRRAGLYRIAWDEGPLGTQQDLYAANPDPRESALERIAATELKALLEPLDVEIVSARDEGGRPVLRDRPRDLARPGAGACSSS